MEFSDWDKENSVEYKGHVIKFGSIWKDGDVVVMFRVPIDATAEENVRLGKGIIDERMSRNTVQPDSVDDGDKVGD